MQKKLTKWKKIYKKLTNWNKIIFMLIGIYYLCNYKEFAISIFPILKEMNAFYLLHPWITIANNIGLLLLVIPLGIVASSLFKEEERSPFFRNASIFISSAGNVLGLCIGFSKGLYLDEYFKVGPILTVFNKISYEKKVLAFTELFNNCIASSNSFFEDKNYRSFVDIYVEKNKDNIMSHLKGLTFEKIPKYVEKVVGEIELSYKRGGGGESLPHSILTSFFEFANNYILPTVFLTVVGGIIIYIIYQGVQSVFGSEGDRKGAEILRDLAKQSLESSKENTSQLKATKDLIELNSENNIQTIKTTNDNFSDLAASVKSLKDAMDGMILRLAEDELSISKLQKTREKLDSISSEVSKEAIYQILETLENNTHEIANLGKQDSRLYESIRKVASEMAEVRTKVQDQVFLSSSQGQGQEHSEDVETRITTLNEEFQTKLTALERRLEAFQHEETNSGKAALARQHDTVLEELSKIRKTKEELITELNTCANKFTTNSNKKLDQLVDDKVQKIDQALARLTNTVNVKFNVLQETVTNNINNVNENMINNVNAKINEEIKKMKAIEEPKLVAKDATNPSLYERLEYVASLASYYGGKLVEVQDQLVKVKKLAQDIVAEVDEKGRHID
jgi:hypothetical protein